MPEPIWAELDDANRDDLPDGMPRIVCEVLDEWLHRAHGVLSTNHSTGLFLDLLYDNGYAVQPVAVAGARSYTTIETMQIDRRPVDDDVLTESLIKAEDPTWKPPDDPDAPVRRLG